ncbi:FecR domain-containing protein [bacterium]|nr:FecR domain-containing protein [bacterium]
MNRLTQKTLIVSLFILCIVPFTEAAIKYGEVAIKSGNVVIVRDHRMLLFTQKNNPVIVYENDTIRTLKGSALMLTNPDEHRVYLGSNAIMQLKKWQKKKESGAIRMLFGKFRAKTATVRKQKSLNLRTATATIGIKGSVGDGNTSPDMTSLGNRSGDMTVTTNDGEEYDVSEGQLGFLVDELRQGVDFEGIPDFDPSLSEDQQETTGTDALNTENSKTAEIPESIREAIRLRVKNIEAAGGIDSIISGERAVPETREELVDYIQEAIDAAAGTGTKMNINVVVED